jgi:hypothetical protein
MVLTSTSRTAARRAGRLNNKTRLQILKVPVYTDEYEPVNFDENGAAGDASAADWRGVEKHEAEVSHSFLALRIACGQGYVLDLSRPRCVLSFAVNTSTNYRK